MQASESRSWLPLQLRKVSTLVRLRFSACAHTVVPLGLDFGTDGAASVLAGSTVKVENLVGIFESSVSCEFYRSEESK